MSALLVGYARCSTDQQDLTAQRDALLGLGVDAQRICVDHGLTGTNRERPGLRQALAACRAGDTLVVTKLDRLARSLPDARAIADELTARQISLSLGGSVYDPTDAVGRLLFNVLAMVAEFESDLIRLRTREGAPFADQSPFSFVRETWESLVVPNTGFFITILIVCEAVAGVLVLSGGRRTQLGLVALIGFHIGQLAFGGVMWVWAPLMLVALVLLLRAERQAYAAPRDESQRNVAT